MKPRIVLFRSMKGISYVWKYYRHCHRWKFLLAARKQKNFFIPVHQTERGIQNYSSRKSVDSTSSLIPEEERKFSDISQSWWDLYGSFRALHSMNEVRVPFIRDCLLYQGYGSEDIRQKPSSLKGLDILDVGCGGGILSEPLARLGADVLGIDASEAAISAAKQHRTHDLENLQYLCAVIEDIASVGSLKFDAVIASEVIEHVAEQESFVLSCASLLKPKGSLFFSTINRTLIAKVLAVDAAELLGIVPKGAHDWQRFVTPNELQDYLSKAQCATRKIHGTMYNPLTDRWSFIENNNINYIVHATRDVDQNIVCND